jgi:hypothetical protein
MYNLIRTYYINTTTYSIRLKTVNKFDVLLTVYHYVSL